MQIIEDIIKELDVYKVLKNNILSTKQIHMRGLAGSLRSVVLACLYKDLKIPLFIVLHNQEKSEWMTDDLASLVGEDSVAFFPGGNVEIEDHIPLNPRKMGLQMQIMHDLFFHRLKIVCTNPEGLALRLPAPEALQSRCIQFSVGKSIDFYRLIETLFDFGYVRESIVEKQGEFSVRGGILDIFPYTGEAPHRLEFDGDQIESIREFDIQTQVSKNQVQFLSVVPTPIAWPNRTDLILSHMPDRALIFLEDPDLIFADVDGHYRSAEAYYLDSDQLEQILSEKQIIFHHTLYSKSELLDFGGRKCKVQGLAPKEIRKGLIALSKKRKRIIILCESKSQKDRIQDFLDLVDHPIPSLEMCNGYLAEGFDLYQSGFTVYTENTLLRRFLRRKRKQRFKEGIPIRELSAIHIGDFVVHIDHGIGTYQGLEKITVNEVSRECLSILYQDGDKLYVPIDKIERVQKYAGKEGSNPELSKLGTKKWEKIKERTKQSIQNIAKDLITLYSARNARSGFAFSPDTTWQKELEATFGYEETSDQMKAIHDVKQDLEMSRPMDRLVCGDVGFGKTEVAIRAAFKAINDGKQVAVLVPTTILAQQHFNTFQERLNRFPVVIELLSRFRTKKEQGKVVHNLKKGSVDIVIGTHRLLSNDIGFKDLGLLIIDEEHRFGVRHKERLKSYRNDVDVLTLSATPIPRTLHLSLSGLRDMSLINTPPKDRLPIVTDVCPFSENVIVEAILKEVDRGGQVFFVHNRVRSIYAMMRMVQRLIPEIRVASAHGQMSERELESVMMDFIDKKYDCLVSTMIIESGLDLPNVNTLIVHRADRFGLAQLYQLRGRVGRSDRRAYAYLMTPPFHHMTQEAIKRIRTIEEFTELGSGFQIAIRDMEIRGIGNLLGVEQSGYMDAVGFDLYNQLIQEVVQEIVDEGKMSQDRKFMEIDCKVDVDSSAYIPDAYVPEESIRVNLYRRLSIINNLSGIKVFSEELRDRFGPLPEEVIQLLKVAAIQLLGSQKGLNQIVLEGNRLVLSFDESWIKHFQDKEQLSEKLHTIINRIVVPARFNQEKGLSLNLDIPSDQGLDFIKNMLQRWD